MLISMDDVPIARCVEEHRIPTRSLAPMRIWSRNARKPDGMILLVTEGK
jgi:hypothetical protein